MKYRSVPNAGSEYKPESNTVVYDPNETKAYKGTSSTVKAHEVAHGAGAMGNHLYTESKVNSRSLNLREIKEINSRNKSFVKDPIDRDSRANEFKADMDSLRYRLKMDNIYDTGTQDFNLEHLKKAKQKYGADPFIKRLFERSNDNDLIYLMNNIAKNKNNTTQYIA